MSLKSLAFTVLPSSTRSPVDARRMKTIERLQEQKQLVENPNYVRVVKKWATVNGQKQLVEKERRVHPWWRTATNGSLVFFVRLGGKPVEFDKGKSGIAVASAEKLPGVIDTLIAAVRNGELDTVLGQVKRPPMQKKKAA
jgi:Family of unknown function (DUF6641)